ncbi:uncharacterized protein VTP21DRAFT_7232 [Calcarisporiella thermophila]|uniref:uncharacterized protein n=1 Tax=Calcarisporiella thermophila TaxID=911321 RepID=UPI003743F8E2
MSLHVNFNTHSQDLQSSYASVLNNDASVNWALYGYDRGTNDLKLIATGDGGLEELAEEFNDGQIQYAFARVQDPNFDLPKFILISWVGSGVPENKKGLFNSHLSDISSRFLKGYHLQINARSEEDVDPEYIMKRVAESSGAKYSIHREAPKPQEPILPVRSVYQKTQIPDIAAMQRESMRKEGPPVPVGTNYKPIVTNPKPLGATSFDESQRRQEEIERREMEQRQAREEIERREAEMRERLEREEKERQERAEMERRNREAQEQREREQREEEERRRMEEEAAATAAAETERKRLELEEEERRRQEEEEKHRQEEEERLQQERLRQEQEAENVRSDYAAPVQETTHESLSAIVVYDYDAAEENEMSLVEGEIITDIVQVDEGWWQGVGEHGKKSGLFPANYVQILEADQAKQAVLPDSHPVSVAPVPEAEASIAPVEEAATGGYAATALYDYEAGEDNEISFQEGEIIQEIEFVSDDWWQGKSSSTGQIGLFPANYVELHQQ